MDDFELDSELQDFGDAMNQVSLDRRPNVEGARHRGTVRRGVRSGLAAATLAVGLFGGVWAVNQIDRSTEQDVAIEAAPDREPTVSTSVEQPATWVWRSVEDMTSLDGSTTGYALRYSTTAGENSGLLIYLDHGTVCLTAKLCESARQSYDAETFAEEFAESTATASIFAAPESINPFAEWSAAYVPHVTGDLHAGSTSSAEIPRSDEEPNLVGANNIEAMLVELVESHGDVTNVVLAGTGAGGMGALLNYEQVAAAFPTAQVDLLVDSAIVPMSQELMPDCLLQRLARSWQRSYPDDWDEVITGTYEQRFAGIYEYLAVSYPDAQLGLLASTKDARVRAFWGRGADNCAGGPEVSVGDYQVALNELGTELDRFPSWSTFFIDGSQSGFLNGQPRTDGGPVPTGFTAMLDKFRLDS